MPKGIRLLPIALFLSFFYFACAPKQQASSAGESEIEGLFISDTTWGKPAWIIQAISAKIKPGNTKATFKKPVLKLFGKGGKLHTIINASAGQANMNEGSGELFGNVHANSKQAELILKTSRLFYNAKRGKIWSDRKVEIRRGKAIVTGEGFSSNLDFSEIEIKNQETRLANESDMP